MKHEAQAADGVLVAERPLVSFLYRLMREGDVAPARLERWASGPGAGWSVVGVTQWHG